MPLLLLATLLSLGPSLAPESLELSLGEGSRLAWAALPWVVLVGVPERFTEGAAAPRRWPLALALSLAPLSLGAWLDARNGLPNAALILTGMGALALILVLGEATYRARGSAPHALFWLAIVLGGPGLALAMGFSIRAASSPPALLEWLAAASPLQWAIERVEPPAQLSAKVVAATLLPLGAALGLLASAVLGRSRAAEPRA